MMGSFLTRGLVMVFGYAYLAYECFKTVERNKPEIEQLGFWCQYWLPMYSEAKLAFFIYLRYPKTRGTTYVYDAFLRPYVAKHENEIDRNLMEMRARTGDMAVLYWQKAASYAKTRVFDILQYFASQSQSQRPRPSQQQQPPMGNHQSQPIGSTHQPPPTVSTGQLPTTPTHQSASQQPQPPPSHQPSLGASSQKQESAQESIATAAPVASKAPPQSSVPSEATSEASTAESSTQGAPEAMQVESPLVLANGGSNLQKRLSWRKPFVKRLAD